MNKGKYTAISKIEIIQSAYVTAVVPGISGNTGTISLATGFVFTTLPFSKGSDNVAIDNKDKVCDVSIQFSIAGLVQGNTTQYNLALYRRFVAKVTFCDGTILIIGDNRNPARLTYNYDKSKARYNISISWQYHRHPLFHS